MNLKELSLILVLVGAGGAAGVTAGADGAPGATGTAVSTATSSTVAAVRPVSEQDAIKELGVKEGKKVATGFVFVGGRYIEAPYTVSRRGRQIFINDALIFEWPEWPLPDLRVNEDPGIPSWITESSTFQDMMTPKNGQDRPFMRKYRYLYQNFSPKVAEQKMVEYLRQLPFMQSVEPEQFGVKITEKNGRTEGLLVGPPMPWVLSFTNKDLLERLDHRRNNEEEHLVNGDAIFSLSVPMNAWSCEYLGKTFAARDLGLIAEILESPRTAKEKIDLLQRMEFLPPPSVGGVDWYMPLITQFKTTPQLQERLAKLAAETGIKPRTLKDIPDEVPYEKAKRLKEEAKKKAAAAATSGAAISGSSPASK
jgi:hypothetical protein